MAKGNDNSYEEARKQRLEDNKKRFEDLGIVKMSKSLSDVTNSEKKSPRNQAKPKSKMTPTSPDTLSLRRSSRARNLVPLYQEEFHVELHRPLRKRSRGNSSTSYIARPLNEIKVATDEVRAYAMECAESFLSTLQSGNPSFVKSMLRSHVYSCFWLGLPTKFCKDHLPSNESKMVLEDENGLEYDTIYIGTRVGLSGGWRGFALDHKLDDGDAVVFELTEPTRFKVYIFRAFDDMGEKDVEDMKNARESKSLNSKKGKKSDTDDDTSEEVVEITKVTERKSLNSKKVKKSNTDDTSEEDVVETTRVRERKIVASKKAKKCDTNDNAKRKKTTKPIELVADESASRRLRQNRGSKKIAKDDDKEVSGLVEVTEHSDEFVEAIEVAKEDQHDSVHSKPQTEVESKKLFRKSSSSTKLFRKKCTWL